MRINQVFGLLVLVVVLVAGITIGFMRIQGGSQSAASPLTLRDLLNSEDCARACWQGIEPGITTGDEARIALEKANIHFENVELPDDKSGVYQFSQNNKNWGMISFTDQAVTQILLPIDACIFRIIDEYGVPAEVQEEGIYIELLYPESGLIFNVDFDDRTRVLSVFLTSLSIFSRRFGDRLDYNWDAFKDIFAGACEDTLDPF